MALSVGEMARMSRLLDEVLSLNLDSRQRWLKRVSTKHPELAEALQKALLSATALVMASVGPDALATMDGFEAQLGGARAIEAGQRIGPYRLVCQLGAGGMAEVWLAQRDDGVFEREVALKLPALSPRRPDLPQRFAREYAILASLDHVNIVRLYDAGFAQEGLPYLVMEYVGGAPLIDWCDARRIDLRERIRLFLQVLDAVQYAHDRHVVHRDLKPSNILVGRDGQVRLIDFGVARRVDGSYRDDSHLTLLYGRALTPAYASLELVRGEHGDAASDVYSLGVVLYELLTGNRPYKLPAGASTRQLERAIATVRIRRPSARLALKAGSARATTQRELAQLLAGDLDAVVLKALSPERRRRYASASALADDLRRYLRGERPRARSDSPLRRAGRLLLRRGFEIAAALALMPAGHASRR